MRYLPKIVDHSSLLASVVLNRTKRINLGGCALTKGALIALYYKLVDYAMCDIHFAYCDGHDKKIEEIIYVFINKVIAHPGLEKALEALCRLFISLSSSQLISSCNNIINRVFLVEVSKILVQHNLLPQPVDFRGMDEAIDWLDYSALYSQFMENIGRTTALNFDYEDPTYWPDEYISSMEIGGFAYLCFEDNFLVTANGGLIQAESVSMMLEKVAKQTGHPHDFKVERGAIEAYLFGRKQGLTTVDGIAFSSSVPLVCLDVDYVTGRVMDESFKQWTATLYEAKENLSGLIETQEHEFLNHPAQHIERIMQYIDIATTRFFKDKRSARFKPQLFATIGGEMSDGTLHYAVDDMASGDYIYVSLHKVLQCTKLYDMYYACGHHLGGYKALQLFAMTLIESIVLKAMQGGYSCYLDNCLELIRPNTLKQLKSAGYEFNLYSTNNMLFLEKDRKDLPKPEILRLSIRIRCKKFLAPITEIITSNITHPTRFMDELNIPTLWDDVRMYDIASASDRTIIAVRMQCNAAQLKNIIESRPLKGRLLKALMLLPAMEEVRLNRHFDLSRLDVLELKNQSGDLHNILVILDVVKFIDVMQKGMLYSKAESYEELLFNSDPGHIPALDYPYDRRREVYTWRLRNQVENGSYLL